MVTQSESIKKSQNRYKDLSNLRGVGGFQQVLALYNDYAFIDERTGKGEDRAGGAVVEAMTNWYHLMEGIVANTYELPVRWYLVIFKPYNAPYGRDPDFFKVKGIDKCRKLFRKPLAYVVTREVEAEKVHVNAIVATEQKLESQHDRSYCSKYKLHVQQLNTLGDRQRALVYITKEHKQRTFIKYLDYITYSRKK